MQNSYNETIIKTHKDEKPYICSECGKVFSQKCHLKRHAQIHTGKKLYQCNQCPKAFSRNDNLNSHMKIHTVAKQYVCDQCEKTFTTKSCNIYILIFVQILRNLYLNLFITGYYFIIN